MIYVIAIIEATDGRRDDLLAEMNQVVPLVRAEEGCLEYQPSIDAVTPIEVQRPFGGDSVVIVERWTGVPTLQKHLQAPHMIEYRKRIVGLVKGAKIHVLQPT